MTAPKSPRNSPPTPAKQPKPRKAKPTAKTPQRAPQAAPGPRLGEMRRTLVGIDKAIDLATAARFKLAAEIARLEKGSLH